MKVYIWPFFANEDTKGEGGVRRVVESQRRYLPTAGVEVVDTPEEADVIAAHIAAPATLLNERFAGKPLVAHNHGFYWAEYDWAGDWAAKDNADVMRLIKAANITTAPSEWVANIIRRHTARDVRVVHHGIDPFEPGAATPAVSDAGRYVLWNKTRVDAVCDPRAVRALARRLPDVPIHTTFWQPWEPRAVAPADDQLPDNVTLLGRQGHTAALNEVYHAGVYLCTTRETFGIGTLEALAAGVPVVAFDFGGQSEIITHLVNGYLAKEGDFDDLARGVMWALEYRDQLRAPSRGLADEFSHERAAEGYAAAYADALRDHRARGMPKVSIIVTAYNLEAYLPATLISVQTQTSKDWECIIVNDASPDNCGALADVMAAGDPRFRVIHNETNQYLAESRNIGIRAARGRYILPLDADDMLTPSAVEIMAGALDRDRQLQIAYGNVRFVEEDGQTPISYAGRQNDPGHSGWPVDFDMANFMIRPGQPMPYASMFRRSAWQLTGGYRRRVRSSEDCDLFVRLASYGFTPQMVTKSDALIYRVRPDSMSSTGWADEENKAWFPWRRLKDLTPAAGRDDKLLAVSLLEPLISVVIPVGPGHAHLVKDAVDSVDAQTFRGWECIVVNDSASDLPELPSWVRVVDEWRLAQWQGRNAKRPPRGVAFTRNAGAARAAGKFLLFLDADDYLMPHAMDALITAEGPDNDVVVYPDFWSVYEDGRQVNDTLPDFDCDHVLSQSLHAVTALYPKAAFDEVEGFSLNVPWEDWDLQLKLAAAGVCSRRLASPVWAYRKDTGTRREDHFARREAAKATMLERWKPYLERRIPLATCATCGSGRTQTAINQMRAMRGDGGGGRPPVEGDLVLLENVRATGGKVTIRGRVTGQMYNFQAGRPRWVDARDAEYFQQIAGYVVRPADGGGPEVIETAPVLSAPGPQTPAQREAAQPAAAAATLARTWEAASTATATRPDISSLPAPAGAPRVEPTEVDVVKQFSDVGRVRTESGQALPDPDEAAAAMARGVNSDMSVALPAAAPHRSEASDGH